LPVVSGTGEASYWYKAQTPSPSIPWKQHTSSKWLKDVATAETSRLASKKCQSHQLSVTGVPFPVCCLSVSDIHSSNCRRAGSSVGSIVYILDKTEVEIEDGCGSLRSYKDSDTKSGGAITSILWELWMV
jgi:hypothetical protein